MKTLIFGFLAIVLTLGITSCGDETEDPKPVVPEYIGYWDFLSAVVTPKTGDTYTVTTLCSDSRIPQFNVEFDVTSETTATQKSPCFSDAPLTYKGTFSNGKLTSIEFKDTGFPSYTFSNIVIDEVSKTITAKQTFPVGDANNITVTFKLL